MRVNWSGLFPVDPDGPTWREGWRRAYASMWPQIWFSGLLLALVIVLTLLGWL